MSYWVLYFPTLDPSVCELEAHPHHKSLVNFKLWIKQHRD